MKYYKTVPINVLKYLMMRLLTIENTTEGRLRTIAGIAVVRVQRAYKCAQSFHKGRKQKGSNKKPP